MPHPTPRLLLCLFLLGIPLVISGPDADHGGPTAAPAALQAAMVRSVGQAVASDAARLFGEESPQHCVVTDALAYCIHPDTPPERLEEILRRLPQPSGDKYQLGDRWEATATDGDVAANAPINLTYSFLPDGTYIPGSNEPGSNSRLYAEMNSHFGSEAVWKDIFAGIFDDWGKQIGVSYTEVADDGATFPNSPGVLGLRGDVRIGAHPIDGTNGVLAYNYFPDVGDMVLDTAEYWSAANFGYRFMRNICRHEHGHGIGLQHVDPINCQKLMEPYICSNFDGPQDDDLRGGMRFYGDTYEFNNSAAAATDLGVLDGVFSPEWPVSITTGVDYDFYRFSVAGSALLNVTVDPVGFRYDSDGAVVQTDEIMDLAFRVLGGVNGSEILIQVDEVGLGDTEMLVDFSLPAAGDYWVLVYRASGSSDVQRYDLTIETELGDVTLVEDDRAPDADLGLHLYPNPFNPRTTARFYAAVPGPVSVDVYDVAGRLVRRLRDRAEAVGWQELSWDGRDDGGQSAPSGAYLMQVRAGGRAETVRGLLLE
jgi:hypothetical protein